MSVNAISGISSVGAVQPVQPALSTPAQAAPAASAEPIPTGTRNALSSDVLAALLSAQAALCGSFASG